MSYSCSDFACDVANAAARLKLGKAEDLEQLTETVVQVLEQHAKAQAVIRTLRTIALSDFSGQVAKNKARLTLGRLGLL